MFVLLSILHHKQLRYLYNYVPFIHLQRQVWIEHLKLISIVKPTRCTIFRVYWISLYILRTVFPSIIGSSKLYIQHQVYAIQVRWLHAGGPASMQSTNLCDIYLMLYVQPWTPDDGRKDRPKYVQWYSIKPKIVHLVGFTVEIYHDTRSHELQTRYIYLIL